MTDSWNRAGNRLHIPCVDCINTSRTSLSAASLARQEQSFPYGFDDCDDLRALLLLASMSLTSGGRAAVSFGASWSALPAELLHQVEQGQAAEDCKSLRLVRDILLGP